MHNQLCWAVALSSKTVFTNKIRERLLKFTWPSNPHAELVLTGYTKIENIRAIKHVQHEIGEKIPCVCYSDKYELFEDDEVNPTYYVCLALHPNLPKDMYEELKAFRND